MIKFWTLSKAARDYYGNWIGELGVEKCMCVYAYNYATRENGGIDLPVIAAKTHECAYKFIKDGLNVFTMSNIWYQFTHGLP